jgi:tetratricopeptide (TPR) repeat protein
MSRWLLLAPLVLCAGVVAESLHADVRNVPIDRLTTNLTRMVKERPQDIELRVNLARVYAMAYARKLFEIPVLTHEPERWQPWFRDGIDMAYQQFEVITSRDAKILAAAKANLTQAIVAYRDVLLLDRDNKVALIGLGWCLSQAGERQQAITVLRRAAAASWLEESSPQASIYAGGGMVQEVARYLIPLLDPERDAAEIAQLQDRIKKLELSPRWITPIVIPLRDALTAYDMVDDDARVPFDLDGSGARRWSWITSDAAWLVNDHLRNGEITSGLQLFGNVSFWAFWRNGYHALRALDDDGDGRLRGVELPGLALWHDRDLDGVSDRGEVRSLADWGIVELATDYDHDPTHQHEIPWSRAGVRFANGTVRPTFDVVLRRW